MGSVLKDIKQDVFGGEEFVFQQDNAPCHVSATSRRWFEPHQIEVLDWPPQSPDLNPIKNLWAILKKKVMRLGPIETKQQLKAAIETAFGEIEETTLLNLVRSMPKRIKGVIGAKGGPVDY